MWGIRLRTNARLQIEPHEGASTMYPFIISSVIPRPIGFVCSLSKEVGPHIITHRWKWQFINIGLTPSIVHAHGRPCAIPV